MFRMLVAIVAFGWLPFLVPSAHASAVRSSHSNVRKTEIRLQAPPSADAGESLSFVVRTAPHTLVQLSVAYGGSTYAEHTGKRGRATFRYVAPYPSHKDVLRVTARSIVKVRRVMVSKKVSIQPFVPQLGLQNPQIVVQKSTGWAQTSQVVVGENVRFLVSYGVTEPAGNFFPPCISGSLRVTNGTTTVLTAPVECPAAQPSNSLPYVYVDTRFTDPAAEGVLTAEFDVAYSEGQFGVAYGVAKAQFTLVPGPPPPSSSPSDSTRGT